MWNGSEILGHQRGQGARKRRSVGEPVTLHSESDFARSQGTHTSGESRERLGRICKRRSRCEVKSLSPGIADPVVPLCKRIEPIGKWKFGHGNQGCELIEAEVEIGKVR